MSISNQPLWRVVKVCRARELQTRRASDKLFKVANMESGDRKIVVSQEAEKLLVVSEYWRNKKLKFIQKIELSS